MWLWLPNTRSHSKWPTLDPSTMIPSALTAFPASLLAIALAYGFSFESLQDFLKQRHFPKPNWLSGTLQKLSSPQEITKGCFLSILQMGEWSLRLIMAISWLCTQCLSRVPHSPSSAISVFTMCCEVVEKPRCYITHHFLHLVEWLIVALTESS